MRKIKPVNYVILAIIFVATIALVLFLKKVYEQKQNYDTNTNERMNILYEIKEDDLKSYLLENSEVVIYMSYASDETLNEFENAFKNYIADQEISKDIVYLNLDTVSSVFYKNLQEKYFNADLKTKKLMLEQPNLLAVENGQIKSILYETKHTIAIGEVKSFLRENQVVTE